LIALWAPVAVLWSLSGGLCQLDERVQESFLRSERLITEVRDRREELGQALRDLTNLNRQLVLVSERSAALRRVAEDAEHTKAAFVAKVSHELRTPLNMIIGLVGLMVDNPYSYDGPIPDDLMEDLGIVHRNSEHLLSMINDVLDLSQVESGRFMLYRERVDLAELISAVSQAVRPLMQKKDLGLDVRIAQDLPEIDCDRVRIRQVMLNLVSNAARFTEEGSIRIEVERQDGHVVVCVGDTGPGIAPEVAARIFEPFVQGDGHLWRDKGGSGLGLSISRQFVRLHGGRIWVESVLGEGSRFYFDLPISQPLDLRPVPGAMIREDWVWRQNAFRTDRAGLLDEDVGPRLVVCDTTGEIGSELVRLFPELDVVLTKEPSEAATAVNEYPARAVILNTADCESLPSALDEVRQMLSGTPLVGCSLPPRLARAYEAGAAGYLVKPIKLVDLAHAIETNDVVRRVLVVDDNADVCRLMERSLHTLDAGLEVISASGGEDGLARMREYQPDLVLLDLVMPGMDGWQFLELKRADPTLRDITVVLISAQDPLESPRTCRMLCATYGDGLSLGQVVQATLSFSKAVLEPMEGPDPTRG
ncbi:MAG: ATP-binding protein, partial [Anaerolineae bacterium]|nr:ATP-binding protein [Anaerolineae bacterium]